MFNILEVERREMGIQLIKGLKKINVLDYLYLF